MPQYWTDSAAAYRSGDVRIDEIAYGDHPRERYDIVWPNTASDAAVKGLAVFVHGGYWIRLDKSYWTHLAEGARAKGWAVCLPSYTLAPEAKVSEMTRQVGAAITNAAVKIPGPIRLAGHSAGGHLASRMMCRDTPLNNDVATRIQHCLSISGLHDLRPLLHTKMNDTLGLDMAEATAESVALLRPNGNPKFTAWVGGDERPEFIRQSQLIAQMWSGLDAQTHCHIDEAHNHFTVVEGLRSCDSAITCAFVDE